MKKYENFVHALSNLEEIFHYEEPYGTVELTGMVALFEICFEQSWKAMKEILENEGFSEMRTGSPKQVLKTAYQANMIQDELLWLNALIARNNVAHSYNKEIATSIVHETKKNFYSMFLTLKEDLEKHWL